MVKRERQDVPTDVLPFVQLVYRFSLLLRLILILVRRLRMGCDGRHRRRAGCC